MIRTPRNNDTLLLTSVSVLVSSTAVGVCFFYISAKKGTCPVPSDDISTCVESRHECSIDHDCDSDMKCCQQACGRVCIEPDIEGMSTYLTNFNL